MTERRNIRFVEVKGVKYLRAEDVAEMIRDMAATEETDVRNRFHAVAAELTAPAVEETPVTPAERAAGKWLNAWTRANRTRDPDDCLQSAEAMGAFVNVLKASDPNELGRVADAVLRARGKGSSSEYRELLG